MRSSVTTRRKSWEKVPILVSYPKFRGQNLGYLSLIFLEAKFWLQQEFQRQILGPSPSDLLIWKYSPLRMFNYMQIHEVNHITILDLTFKQLVTSLGYLWPCTIRILHMCTCDMFLHLKHWCTIKVSLQRNLSSKAQHLQRDLHLEVQHLMICCASVVLAYYSLLLFYARTHSCKTLCCVEQIC